MIRPEQVEALNASAKAYLRIHTQAHSDVGSEFVAAIRPLGATQILGNQARYDAPLVIADNGIAFACATGMTDVHFRLPIELAQRAIRTGADPSPIGEGWVCFVLFRSDWPRFDLEFWARKAYEFVRTAFIQSV